MKAIGVGGCPFICPSFGSGRFFVYVRATMVASVLLVVGLPLQLAGFLGGPVGWFMWLPMLVFEVALALWLLIKGVAILERG